MRSVKKALLWILTVAIPVTIAACYGVAQRFSMGGRVTDATTGDGIEGIEVTCVDAGSFDSSMTWSDANGDFSVDYDTPCATVRADDVDGADNGSYVTATVPFDENADEILIEMDSQ